MRLRRRVEVRARVRHEARGERFRPGTVVAAVGALLIGVVTSVASAQEVVVGPGVQSGIRGQEAKLAFAFRGAASRVSSFAFSVLYDPETAPYEPVTLDGELIDCAVERGVNGQALVFFIPERGLITVRFGDLTFPIEPLGRSGTVLRCRVTVRPDVAAAEFPLRCDPRPGATSASDIEGNSLSATCSDGSLTVADPVRCIGDCNGDGMVTAGELVTGALIALEQKRPARCAPFDPSGDGEVTITELLAAVSRRKEGCPKPP